MASKVQLIHDLHKIDQSKHSQPGKISHFSAKSDKSEVVYSLLLDVISHLGTKVSKEACHLCLVTLKWVLGIGLQQNIKT